MKLKGNILKCRAVDSIEAQRFLFSNGCYWGGTHGNTTRKSLRLSKNKFEFFIISNDGSFRRETEMDFVSFTQPFTKKEIIDFTFLSRRMKLQKLSNL
jgi:hypothetical protein